MENLVTFSDDSNGKAVKTDKHRAFHLRKYSGILFIKFRLRYDQSSSNLTTGIWNANSSNRWEASKLRPTRRER